MQPGRHPLDRHPVDRHRLDQHQQKVVDAVAQPGHGPLLLLAGPGTGKTTTVVEAVAARVEQGVHPDRILTLTFSRKAAQELRARIGMRLQRTVSRPLAWTFHGFGYSLLEESQPSDDTGRALRLISAPEQDVALRELLRHDADLGRVQWPVGLRAALPTRGFTDEVRNLLSRARSLGLDPEGFASVAAERPDWAAAADFMGEYLDVLDVRGVIDYAELVARAVAFAESSVGGNLLRKRYDLVVVDEYQDTDPAQERLLQAIAGNGRDLLAVGDPDQSIYGFRGADVHNILDFPDRFRASGGEPATTMVLKVSRRCSPEILNAAGRVAARLGGAGGTLLPFLREHRNLTSANADIQGSVEALTFITADAEAAWIADALRREHLQHGTQWAEMAVLVRSGTKSIPQLARSLTQAGVPVEVAGDERPLVAEPSLAPMLSALRVAVEPSFLTSDVARELLLSPLGGMDSGWLRRLGRALRDRERAREGLLAPASSALLIHRALLEPDFTADLPAALRGPAQRLGDLLAKAQHMVELGATTHEVLWVLWSDSGWSRRLAQSAAKDGGAAHAANRELDAMVALFEAASRLDERTTAPDVASFLAEIRAQQIPGDTLSERTVRFEGVRLLTAHRSKGLEWEVVVVASVQADVWPDLRRRGSLLEPDRLRTDGLSSPPSLTEVRRDERRLFYVAMTRAKRRLVVTAVDSPADEGLRPSSFVAELDVSISPVVDHPVRPLTLAGVCAELRAVVTDDEQPKELREAAALRLAMMAMTEIEGQPLIRAADPQHWWGLSELTHSGLPIRSADAPLDLSGSALEGLNDCALKWFLSREVRGEYTRGTAAGFGGVIHALADGVGRGELQPSVDVLVEQADSVWSQLQYGAAWESEAEHQAAVEALGRFVDWHKATRGRFLVATEKPFEVTISVAGREVRLRGRLDRVELDDEGRVVVVDLKTGRYPPSAPKVERHLQLATYQRVVAENGLDNVHGEPGGAELVHLRHDQSARSKSVKVQQQQAYPAGEETLQQALLNAVAFVGNETFHASPGDSCSFCPFTTSCPAQDSGRQVVP